MRWMTLRWIAAFALILMALPAMAGEVEIVDAEASRETAGSWRFSVTLRHADEGWDHYADMWRVEAPDGTVLGERELLHPHVDEQPFTRSLSGVAIPDDLDEVVIRARDNVDGWAEETLIVTLPD